MPVYTVIPERDIVAYQNHGSLQDGINFFEDWVAIRNQSPPNSSYYRTINQDLLIFSDQLVLDGASRQELNQIAGWSD